MTNIRGNNRVILDSDALIGLIHTDDALHTRCIKVTEFLAKNSFSTIIPYPIVLEAATTLTKDKTIRRPDLAAQLLQDYAHIEDKSFDENVASLVASLYHPKTSKKNSPFDFYVLACAKKNSIQYVFSFDSFYKKNGLRLIEDVIESIN